MKKALSELIDEWLKIADSSEIGLWWIYADIKENLNSQDTRDVKMATLDVLGMLIPSEKLFPISFDLDRRYRLWNETPTNAFQRISTELIALDGAPDIGQICMFVGKGHELLKSKD